MQIDIACNNSDNGMFDYRATMIQAGCLELEYKDERGCKFNHVTGGEVRLSRRVFHYQRMKEWYGNWCWNAYWLDPPEGKRLIRYLRESGNLKCVSGPARLYDWFNAWQKDRANGLSIEQ